MTVAVNPAAGGAVGALVNMPDATHGLLARWTPANDRGASGDRLTLLRLADGKQTVLAESPGGYVPGQWYALSVVSTWDSVRVLVDGRERIAVNAPTPWRGGVGLYAETGAGGASTFDDVTVYGHTLDTDMLLEAQEQAISQRFLNDDDMKSWARSQSDWEQAPRMPDFQRYRWPFYGDQWMTLTVKSPNASSGSLVMLLNGDGEHAERGYRVAIESGGNPLKWTYTLYRDAAALATVTRPPLDAGEDYTLRFRHMGNRVWLEIDGDVVIQATDDKPLPGVRPAYRASGCFAQVSDILMLGHNQLNYTFANAPVDWMGEGAWSPSIRWTCAPQFSFLSGWSRGDAALWNKRRIMGDQVFQAFVGLKMEYPREQEIYENRYKNLAITICGDGGDPRSGYTAIFGAPDEQGHPNQRTVLLRNGQVVAFDEPANAGQGVRPSHLVRPLAGEERPHHQIPMQISLAIHVGERSGPGCRRRAELYRC